MSETHLGELLSAYLDGELGHDEQARVVAHLEGCPACRDELFDIESARSVLRSLPVLESARALDVGAPPADFVAARRRRRRFTTGAAAWVAAAAAVVLIAVGSVGMARSGSSGADVEMADMIDRHNVRVSADLGLPAVQVVQVVQP